uniref:flagellar hook-basal body protein n=1 Tax=uncultured Allobacillus sp. TaxID=1638025 RepID=UPI0025952E85|nr:flagellar hook-basal body protein [uncultured Allobacillus sp.]
MLRGLHTAGSGMIAQQRYQDSLSNNMSNALTPGYKQDRGTFRAFPEMLIQNIQSQSLPTKRNVNIPNNHIVGSLHTGTYMQEDVPLFTQGDVEETGISTDLALINQTTPDETGFLFFTVTNEQGEPRLTRNGNFTVDAEGYLTTPDGYYVMDTNNERIQTGTENFEVTANGQVISPVANTDIQIAYQENANALTKEGNNLWALEEGTAIGDARTTEGVNFSINQGSLERSNVDPQQMMTEMMRSYRMFEMNQQVVRMFDQSLDLAANQVGRLR